MRGLFVYRPMHGRAYGQEMLMLSDKKSPQSQIAGIVKNSS